MPAPSRDLSQQARRAVPAIAVGILGGPVLVGLLFVVLPAFGYLPALGGTALSLEPWRLLFEQPGLWHGAAVSLAAGLVTGAASLKITGLFLAGFHGSRSFEVLRRLVSPLLAVPHAAAALGLAFLISPSGLVFRFLAALGAGFDRPPDLLIVHDPLGLAMMAGLIVKEVPFLLLMSIAALPQIGAPQRVALARTLGYGPVTAWLKTVAPALYPLIRLPVLAVIAYSSSVYDVAVILGPTNPPPLSVAVLRWQSDPDLSARFMAAAGALLQLGVTGLALTLWWLGERGVAWLAGPWFEAGRRRWCDRQLAFAGGAAMALVAGSAVFGFACLAIWSFAIAWRFPDLVPREITLANWTHVLPMTLGPLLTTLLVGLASTTVSVLVTVAALEHELRTGRPAGAWAMRLLYLPLLVPQVAFLFGLVVAAEAGGIPPGLLPVALGHVVFVLPYVYLSLSEPYRRLDPRWSQIAATLGAGYRRTFWQLRLPLLLAPCLTAFALGFAVSAGQYLATELLGAGRVETLTTEAVALSSGGERRIIGVWVLLQMLLPAVGFAAALGIPRLLWSNRRAMLDTQ